MRPYLFVKYTMQTENRLLYVSLGANIGRREESIRRAVEIMEEKIGWCAGCSRLYETEPQGFASPHRFLNAAAAFITVLSASEILKITQDIERRLGRTAKSAGGQYADRPIDIDLLMLGDEICDELGLRLPHPLMAERQFVLEPLCEIAPQIVVPQMGKTVRELLLALQRPVIVRAESVTESLLAGINRLLPQLSSSAAPLTPESLARLLRSEDTYIYIVPDAHGTPQAMATLCLCASPTGTKAWIEDVVTDCAMRGRGYGRALIDHLCAEARRMGAKSINLTSRPEREAANRLYRSLGFEQRDTNVYRCR